MNRRNKNQFIQTVRQKYEDSRKRYQDILNRFATANDAIKDNVKDSLDSLEKCLNDLEWRIQHFEKDRAKLDDVVEDSFENLLNEIDWRFKDVELGLEGKSIIHENEQQRLAKNIRRK